MDERERRALAKLIIWFAQRDGTLDAATLRDRAVEAFGVPVPHPFAHRPTVLAQEAQGRDSQRETAEQHCHARGP